MSKIKIVSVSFENFKGFEKKEVLFYQYQSIIFVWQKRLWKDYGF